MKKIFYAATVALISLASCGKSAETTDSVAESTVIADTVTEVSDSAEEAALTEEEVSMTEEEAIALTKELWEGLPDHGLNNKTQSCLSAAFYAEAKRVFEAADKSEDGGMEYEDAFYWYTAQDKFESDGIRSVKILMCEPDKIEAEVVYDNMGSKNKHTLTIIKEKGKWVIDSFDNMIDILKSL